MSFGTIAKHYLASLYKERQKALATNESTPELSYRPILDTFFRNIAKLISLEIEIIFEPKRQGSVGRPDWRFYNSSDFGVYGYVEAKELSLHREISIDSYAKQIEKYLSLGHHVILTDGLEFVFFDADGSISRKFHLISKPVEEKPWDSLLIDQTIENQFRLFFQQSSFRNISEEDLIKEAAKRATQLSELVEMLTRAPLKSGLSNAENKTIEKLHHLKSVLLKHHDSELIDPKKFGDFVAQVLIFGLLYAHRVIIDDGDTPKDKYVKIHEFWINSAYSQFSEPLLPFKALIEELQDEITSIDSSSSALRTWYDDCRRLLAYIKIKEDQRKTPDYHTLFEKFLAAFDPQTRFDYGAYYTPKELAKFVVNLVREITFQELEGVNLFDRQNKLIDPCCGTGSFLEQLLLNSFNIEQARIIGFEILPGPYALAHYRLGMLRKEIEYGQNVYIMLTNTLSDDLEKKEIIESENLLAKEQAAARELVRPPLILVIGNPPSSDSVSHSSGPNFSNIHELIEDFRPPKNERINRQNIQKQLNNDFIKFLRWSSQKVIESSQGILALIIPSSFATHPSYKYARIWLCNNFEKFWFLNIDLDLRTGTGSSNLFNVLQGRMLLVAFRSGKRKKNSSPALFHCSITHFTKQKKIEWLDSLRSPQETVSLFKSFAIESDSCQFSPSLLPAYDKAFYSRCWAMYSQSNQSKESEAHYVFLRHCSGVKLAPSSLFVHPSIPHLKRRLGDISDLKINVDDLINRWFSGQKKPPRVEKLTDSIRKIIGLALSQDDNIIQYTFRPFLIENVFISKKVLDELGSMPNSGTRIRGEVLSAFSESNTIGLALAPSRLDIGDELHRFISFCWALPDNDLCSRGNAKILCNQFPEYKTKKKWNAKPVENINPLLMNLLSRIDPKVSSEDVVYYVYGILSSTAYLNKFIGTLFSVSDTENIPRVPFVYDKDLFHMIKTKGKELAELERSELISVISPKFDCYMSLYTVPFELVKYKIDSKSDKIQLFNSKNNVAISIDSVPAGVCGMKISGYGVVDQWIKFHTYPYTRMAFDYSQFRELIELLFRLENQIVIIKELDHLIEPIICKQVPLL
jgi:hypothetical protein